MDALAFAQWLANLLDGASPTGDSGIRIVVTDPSGQAAEVIFDGEWMWESVDFGEVPVFLRKENP